MAHAGQTGFSEAAKALVGEAYDVFKYIAIGKGTGQGASDTTLADECDETGLTRVECDSYKTITTTIANDTAEFVHTFTCGATGATVTECLIGNSGTLDEGDKLIGGDLVPAAVMTSGKTMKITATCQVKAA